MFHVCWQIYIRSDGLSNFSKCTARFIRAEVGMGVGVKGERIRCEGKIKRTRELTSWFQVVGWGKDIKGESTESLQEIDMPFVPYHQCLSAVPLDFQGFLTSDKFCAGHLNGKFTCANNCEIYPQYRLRRIFEIALTMDKIALMMLAVILQCKLTRRKSVCASH